MTDINLKSIVGRIEPLEEKQKALLADKRAIYMEAKKAGFNTKALRKIIAERRMKDREEVLARIHEYRVALGMAVYDVGNGASLREAATKHGVAKSTIHDAVRREEKAKIGQPAEDTLELPAHLRRPRPTTSPTLEK